MVVGAFPLAKLFSLAIKQISKPVANSIKTAAKQSPAFRKYVCMFSGQGYHWLETNVKMRLMGLAAPAEVKPLSEHRAVDLGAEILGESVVFVVGAATLYFEYKRSQRKEEKKEEEQNSRISQLQRELQDLELTVETQSTQLRELTRLVHSNDTDNRSTLSGKAKKEGKNIRS